MVARSRVLDYIRRWTYLVQCLPMPIPCNGWVCNLVVAALLMTCTPRRPLLLSTTTNSTVCCPCICNKQGLVCCRILEGRNFGPFVGIAPCLPLSTFLQCLAQSYRKYVSLRDVTNFWTFDCYSQIWCGYIWRAEETIFRFIDPFKW